MVVVIVTRSRICKLVVLQATGIEFIQTKTKY
jgi:hypothetical protein